ncbi:hypothetical protein KI387_001159 [Taxus chinensis]|uniref:Uncharacterized protein n=1 Tax=Taxus chinensis TaxID=29808 RepID=A0AA38GVG5_TAXCH|nr:hypothetical protein KI387_001159 [Taxus chinensis]
MVCERTAATAKRPSFAESKAMNPGNLTTIEEEKETHCNTAKETAQIQKETKKLGLHHKGTFKTFMKGFSYEVRNEAEEEKEDDSEEESLSDAYIKHVLEDLEEYDEDEYEDLACYYASNDDDDDLSFLEENGDKEGYATAEDDEENNDEDVYNGCHKVCNYKNDSCEDSSYEDYASEESGFEDSDNDE